MTTWYALVCTKDRLNAAGNVEYKVGDVYTWTKEVISADRLRAADLKSVSIGDYELSPPFDTHIWDPATESLVPRPVVVREEQALLDKVTWTDDDRDAALRIILRRFI